MLQINLCQKLDEIQQKQNVGHIFQGLSAIHNPQNDDELILVATKSSFAYDTKNKPFSNSLQFSQFPTQFLQHESFVIWRIIRFFFVNRHNNKRSAVEGSCEH